MPPGLIRLVVIVAVLLCGSYVVFAERLPISRRHTRGILLLVLSAELLLAGSWRW